jgi:protein SCO1/2
VRRNLATAAAASFALLAAGCGGTATGGSPPSPAPPVQRTLGTALDGSPAPAFSLRTPDRRTVSLASLRGDWVLVTFLYTHCPDVCPLIATNIGAALRNLPAGTQNVRAVAISVDPEGDTPASVRRFVRAHRLPASFEYLIGSRAELSRVWRAYHVAADGGPEDTVDHSAYTLLVDPSGRQRARYDARIEPRQVLHDLRVLD